MDNFQLTPSPLDLGNVPVGGFASGSLIVSNATGNPSVTVTQFTIAGTGFSLVSPPTLPLTLDGGGSVSLEVGFTAPGLGLSTGTLTIANDGSIPDLAINLSATGVVLGANQLGVSPGVFSFGSIPVGSHQSLGGSLTAGGSDVLVSSSSWSGAGFSVTGITFPVTVPAGQSVPFTVRFAPTGPGPVTGGVSFISNASNSPTGATFSGTGTQATQVQLSWNDNDSVAGYNVYRGTTSGGPLSDEAQQFATVHEKLCRHHGAIGHDLLLRDDSGEFRRTREWVFEPGFGGDPLMNRTLTRNSRRTQTDFL